MLAKPQKRLLGSVRCSGVNTWPREGARLVLSRPKAAKLTPARSGGSRSEGVARCPPNVRGACPGSAPSRDRPASVRAALRYPTACEDGIQLVGAAPQLRERVAVGVFGEPAPIGVAEHVGEEDHFVVARRLEQNDVGVRVLPGVALHADAHARVDERAKSLRQHGHEAAIRVTNQPNRAMEQFFFAHRYTTDDNVAASREAARRMALDRWAVLDRYLGDNGPLHLGASVSTT